jgi:hypothetical protein
MTDDDRLVVDETYTDKGIPHKYAGKRGSTHDGKDGRIYTFEFADHPESSDGPGEFGELARNIVIRRLPVAHIDTHIGGVTDLGETDSETGRHLYRVGIFVHEGAFQ